MSTSYGWEDKRQVWPVAYLRGPLCEGPPFGRTAVIFVTILGLFLPPFRDKIAATSDQMRFLAGKCSEMRLRPGLGRKRLQLTALPQRCQPVYC